MSKILSSDGPKFSNYDANVMSGNTLVCAHLHSVLNTYMYPQSLLRFYEVLNGIAMTNCSLHYSKQLLTD